MVARRRSMLVILALVVCARTQGHADSDACNRPAPQAIALVDLPGRPFQPIATKDGCWIFVSLIRANPRSASGVAVLKRAGGKFTLVRVVRVEPAPLGMVLSSDGKMLVVADIEFVVFMDAASMISGRGDPILGYVSQGESDASSYPNLTSDDRTLFVSDEDSGTITVIDVAKARRSGFKSDAIVGRIPVGHLPIAVTFSPDERTLYTTSQIAPASFGWAAECKPEGQDPATAKVTQPPGAIIVVDVAKARTDPAHAVIATARAGCSAVRLVLSPRGDVAYVTARNENALLAFDTAKLIADPAHALLGRVPVGTAPVGVATIDGGTKVVVANSNRFAGKAKDRQFLTVIDAGKIAAGAGAVLGTIPAGAFPRELRVTADGKTLLVTNFNSSTLEIVDLGRLPLDRVK